MVMYSPCTKSQQVPVLSKLLQSSSNDIYDQTQYLAYPRQVFLLLTEMSANTISYTRNFRYWPNNKHNLPAPRKTTEGVPLEYWINPACSPPFLHGIEPRHRPKMSIDYVPKIVDLSVKLDIPRPCSTYQKRSWSKNHMVCDGVNVPRYSYTSKRNGSSWHSPIRNHQSLKR